MSKIKKTQAVADSDDNSICTTDDCQETNQKSELASQIDKLKASVNKAIESRDRIPQPLFWSLFNSKIKELKEEKQNKRKISDLLGE